jgi:hypothetical protein
MLRCFCGARVSCWPFASLAAAQHHVGSWGYSCRAEHLLTLIAIRRAMSGLREGGGDHSIPAFRGVRLANRGRGLRGYNPEKAASFFTTSLRLWRMRAIMHVGSLTRSGAPEKFRKAKARRRRPCAKQAETAPRRRTPRQLKAPVAEVCKSTPSRSAVQNPILSGTLPGHSSDQLNLSH